MWPFSTHLPVANGPYNPGCIDVMTEYSRSGLFFRLYYPTSEKSNIKNYINQWIPWLPNDSYVRGFSRVISVSIFIIRFVLWFVSGKLYIPAIYGAKIKNDKKLKCIIFSHGLGGSRFLYSKICIELASRGFMVVAIEHRDESSGHTYFYKSKEDAQCDKKSYINYVPVKLGPDHYVKRNSQIMKRADECRKLFETIRDINTGTIPYNVLDDVPTNRQIDFILEDLEGKIDIDNVTMIGHSLGAATTLVTLAKNPEIKCGVILDAWMFPIKNMPELLTDLKQPLQFINTQTFHIDSNVKLMEKFVEQNVDQRPVHTILHTTHESQTDMVFAAGYWLNWFMKKLRAEHALRINNALILVWLRDQMNIPEQLVEDCDQYLKQENHNVANGIDALNIIIKKEYKSIFKMFV